MKCEVKNVKIHNDMSEETMCFSAVLYIDGKKAADVSNRGHGGCHLFYWMEPLEAEFKRFCESLPPIKTEMGDLPMDMDGYVDELVIDFDERKRLKRHCKTSTLFRLKTDKKGDWRVMKIPFNQKVKEHIIAKYADLDVIANELIVP
jgi:hypothetical protein